MYPHLSLFGISAWSDMKQIWSDINHQHDDWYISVLVFHIIHETKFVTQISLITCLLWAWFGICLFNTPSVFGGFICLWYELLSLLSRALLTINSNTQLELSPSSSIHVFRRRDINFDKYIWQFQQIHSTIWTNTFDKPLSIRVIRRRESNFY